MSPAPSSPIWHPFTQHALTPDFPLIETGEGAWLTDSNGRRILDAISSWWVITHGHRQPKIMAAIEAQAKRLDQVIFANFTHEPAEDVARGLIEVAPRGLSKVFFSDSGSTAVEVLVVPTQLAHHIFGHRGRGGATGELFHRITHFSVF